MNVNYIQGLKEWNTIIVNNIIIFEPVFWMNHLAEMTVKFPSLESTKSLYDFDLYLYSFLWVVS